MKGAVLKTVKIGELRNIRMVGHNEKKYPQVIFGDRVHDWVGFGWVDSREATAEDYENLHVAID
jgi:hypothetical protein